MKILSIKKATPMSTGVIVTCDRYTAEDTTHDGIEDVSMTGGLKKFKRLSAHRRAALIVELLKEH